MAVNDFTLWYLRATRAAIAELSPKVSLSFFWWWKEPGNHYVTFFPTAWLPDWRDQPAREDTERGRALFDRAVCPGKKADGFTLGTYGDGALSIPGWANLRATGNIPVCSHEIDPDPQTAGAKIAAAINLHAMRRAGARPDLDTSRTIDTWMDAAIHIAAQPACHCLEMDFAKNLLPMALWLFECNGSTMEINRELWWPDRAGLSMHY